MNHPKIQACIIWGMYTLLCLVLTAGCFLLGLLGGIFSVLAILMGISSVTMSVYAIRDFVMALRQRDSGPWDGVAAQSIPGMNHSRIQACVLSGMEALVGLVFT